MNINNQYICSIFRFLYENRLALLLNSLSGAVLGLSAPGFNMWFLAWFMIFPLLALLALSKTKIQVVCLSFCYGMFYHIVYYSWFAGLHPLTWMGLTNLQSILLTIFVIIALACYSSLFYTLFGLTAKYIFNLKTGKTLLIPLSWVVIIDILASYGVFAFNWAMIQYSQYQVLPIIQVTSLIGGRGLEFVMVMANTALTLLAIQLTTEENNESKIISSNLKRTAVNFIPVLIVIITIIIYGYNKILINTDIPNTNTCVTQAALPVEYFRSANLSDINQYRAYKNLIKTCPAGLVVLPEGAIATDLKKEYSSALLFSLKKLAYQKQASLIIGGYGHLPKGETNAVTVITKNKPKTSAIPVYHKQHLVPFGEYTPFREFLPKPLEKFASISSTRDFAKGKTANPLQTDHGQAGVLICYETIFPSMARELVHNGASFLVNTSNLGWFHNSIVDQQFIAMCVLRAVENDRYFVVAINNGSSAIISPQGKILAQTIKSQPDSISAKIEAKQHLTFYNKWNLP